MAININSEATCRKAYLNYHCYGNTMGISAEEMGKITQAWSDRLSSWQASVSSDENEYDFDDSEYASYKKEGKEAAKDATDGYERDTGENTKSIGTTVASGLLGGAMAYFAYATLCCKKAKDGSKYAAKPVLWWLAGVEAALSLAYWATRPNKEAKEACDVLQTEETGAQATLDETQVDMETMGEDIINLSDKATTYNEDANEEIEEQKSEYDRYYESFMAIQAKIDAGKTLTESEKELYKTAVGYLNEIGIYIEELSEETTDEVADLYEEMDTYQDGYDNAAEKMGEIEGLTDYAESFDSATRNQCYALGATMGLNAAATGVIAGKLFADANIYTKVTSIVFGGISAAAAVSSGFAAAEQFKWAGEVGTEIDMRKDTQGLNTETMNMYTEEIDAYDGWMQGVEDLELEIPDDVAPVEGGEIPTEEPTGAAAVPDPLKPKKEEEETKQT